MARNKLWIGIALTALLCVSCFSPWRGEDVDGGMGTVEIRIGSGGSRAAVMPYPPADKIGELAHKVTLTRVELNSVAGAYEDAVTSSFQDSIDIPAGTNPIKATFDVTPGYYAIEVVGTWNGRPYSYFESDRNVMPTVSEEGVVQVVTGQMADASATMSRDEEWPVNGLILIENEADLKALATQSDPANFPLNGNYLLMNDLDLSILYDATFTSWKPIGDNSSGDFTTWFTGSFDGNNKTISGLYINDAGVSMSGLGLFGGIANGPIKNLMLVSPTINAPSSNSVGAIVGESYTAVYISNCVVQGGSVTGNYYVGGVVGSNSCRVAYCQSTALVTGIQYVGGVVGTINSAFTIEYCSATGDVEGNIYVGGVVGRSGFGVLRNCYATGNVTGAAWVGGVVGSNEEGVVEKCYASGSVTAIPDAFGGLHNYYIGGVVGLNASDFFAPNSPAVIQLCVALNLSLSMTPAAVTNYGRVMGGDSGTSSTSSQNRANDSMTISPVGTSWSGVLDRDGTDVTDADARTASWWRANLPEWSEDDWSFEDGRLPKLAWELEEPAP